jgi:Domain of unknown function (4846)
MVPPKKPALLVTLFLVLHFPAVAETLTLENGIVVPAGYQRQSFPENSYSHFLQTLPLKADKSIRAFNGATIDGFHVLAVANIPLLFKQDLEQCADFAMRLWAEYHRRHQTLDRFYLFDYNGKRRSFSTSGKSYASFLKWSFANTNSYSLKRGCAKVDSESELIPGDMLVQNEDGGIGHVSVILDRCEKPGQPRLYLIGFSYMPAQEFHIEKATAGRGLEGWFTLDGFKAYLDETLPYGPPALRRFAP